MVDMGTLTTNGVEELPNLQRSEARLIQELEVAESEAETKKVQFRLSKVRKRISEILNPQRSSVGRIKEKGVYFVNP